MRHASDRRLEVPILAKVSCDPDHRSAGYIGATAAVPPCQVGDAAPVPPPFLYLRDSLAA
jgi:hypothetical protein